MLLSGAGLPLAALVLVLPDTEFPALLTLAVDPLLLAFALMSPALPFRGRVALGGRVEFLAAPLVVSVHNEFAESRLVRARIVNAPPTA